MASLDHAAATPMMAEAREAVLALLAPAGSSTGHLTGRRAARSVEQSRETVAAALGARPSQVVFCDSGTESDNLAVKGLYWARRDADPARTRVLASRVEHHAVLDAVQWLVEHAGAQVTWLDVDELGRVHPEVLEQALGDDVALATVMWANNEVGTVQPVRVLAETAHASGVPLHTDAVQAVGQLPVDFAASGVDALTVTGHKYGGPHGGAALLLADGVPCTPLLHGDDAEGGRRAGRSNVPVLAGFATATRLAVERRSRTAEHLTQLRDDLVRRVLAAVPEAEHNGDPVDRLPGNAHFSFPGCEGDQLVLLLDARGVEAATGSACVSGVAEPSHVLTAMGSDPARARSSLRFSLGPCSTPDDVDALLDVLPAVVRRARRPA